MRRYLSLSDSLSPFILPKYNVNIDSYLNLVDFKLFYLEVHLPSIHLRVITPLSCWQLETITICITVTDSVIIGISLDH